MDHREIKLLGHLLQVKHMAHLHSRIITFISNIYVTGKFQTLLSIYVLPAVMELLIYNITTYKPNLDAIDKPKPEEPEVKEEPKANPDGSIPAPRYVFELYRVNISSEDRETQPTSNFSTDMHKELIESICFLLGNLTTSGILYQ